MSQTTAAVYRFVIDDVVAKMKPEVVQEGLDESVLDELRTLWEAKLSAKGVFDPEPPAPAAPPPVAQIPMGLPSGLLLRPPGQAAMGMSAPNQATAMALANLAAQIAAAQAAGLMPNPMTAAALAGMKRETPDSGFDAARQGGGAAAARGPAGGAGPSNRVPQRDGPADDDAGDDDEAEDADAAVPAVAVDDDEDPLSSDSEEEEPEDDMHLDFLCCQFEKVGRTKNKWKVAMKEGVFHINGRDYLFKKAQGEWIF